jgi:hypothetical protein
MKRIAWTLGLICCLLLLLLAGCGTLPLEKTFADQNANINEQSYLHTWTSHIGRGAIVNSIDNRDASFLGTPFLVMSPGLHIISMSYSMRREGYDSSYTIISSSSPNVAAVDFIPGHYYAIISGDSTGPYGEYMKPKSFFIGIIDYTNTDNPLVVWANYPEVVVIASQGDAWKYMRKQFDSVLEKDK